MNDTVVILGFGGIIAGTCWFLLRCWEVRQRWAYRRPW